MSTFELILPWKLFVKIVFAYILRAVVIWFFMYLIGFFLTKFIMLLNFSLNLNLNTQIPPFKYIIYGSLRVTELLFNIFALKLALDTYLPEIKSFLNTKRE